MKFKVGDKVRHDGGDWWLYGRVSAVFEHSISPCYRMNVERMEKKSCKFSITQFEFELEPWYEEDSIIEGRKWEGLEVEYLKKYYGILNNEDLAKFLQRSPLAIEEKWQQLKIAPKQKVEQPKAKSEQKVEAKAEPILNITPQKAELQQKVEKQAVKKKGVKQQGIVTAAWYKNLENYKKGDRSNVTSAWASQNRKDYKTGKLLDEKYDMLVEIKFPFESNYKKKKGYGTII